MICTARFHKMLTPLMHSCLYFWPRNAFSSPALIRSDSPAGSRNESSKQPTTVCSCGFSCQGKLVSSRTIIKEVSFHMGGGNGLEIPQTCLPPTLPFLWDFPPVFYEFPRKSGNRKENVGVYLSPSRLLVSLLGPSTLSTPSARSTRPVTGSSTGLAATPLLLAARAVAAFPATLLRTAIPRTTRASTVARFPTSSTSSTTTAGPPRILHTNQPQFKYIRTSCDSANARRIYGKTWYTLWYASWSD